MRVTSLLPDWLTFRRFTAFTTALTLALVMLGVYTAATGSGLACSAQWPLCDNGLLPQTVPSFIEWFHRLVAMVTGWFILGTAAWAWRGGDRRTRLPATLAVVLLPLQISIGAVTVTLSGMFPRGYSPPTQGAHLLVALTIFTALVVATLRSYEGHYDRPRLLRVRHSLLAAVVLFPVMALFSRLVPAVPYTPDVQAVYYGTSLALFGSVVAATAWLRGDDSGLSRLRYLTGAALSLVFVSLLLGRDLVYYTPTVRAVDLGIVSLAAALVVAATVTVYRATDGDVGSVGLSSQH
ncbi:MAG: COX15/CtaA family protein [Haloferacaceae archaeon]